MLACLKTICMYIGQWHSTDTNSIRQYRLGLTVIISRSINLKFRCFGILLLVILEIGDQKFYRRIRFKSNTCSLFSLLIGIETKCFQSFQFRSHGFYLSRNQFNGSK